MQILRYLIWPAAIDHSDKLGEEQFISVVKVRDQIELLDEDRPVLVTSPRS